MFKVGISFPGWTQQEIPEHGVIDERALCPPLYHSPSATETKFRVCTKVKARLLLPNFVPESPDSDLSTLPLSVALWVWFASGRRRTALDPMPLILNNFLFAG
jgi:hypothetical protein